MRAHVADRGGRSIVVADEQDWSVEQNTFHSLARSYLICPGCKIPAVQQVRPRESLVFYNLAECHGDPPRERQRAYAAIPARLDRVLFLPARRTCPARSDRRNGP